MPTDLPPTEQLACWSADIIRLTAFPDPNATIASQEWWSHLLGQLPESRTQRPMEATILETGSYNGGTLTLAVRPGRIDWLLAPTPTDTPESEATMPHLGPFVEVLTTFSQLADKWFKLETCPPIVRLALGTVLCQPTTDKPTAYRKLASYLPSVQIDCEGSSDFLYRISRRKQAKTPPLDGLPINRLSTWHAIRWHLVVGQIFPQTSQPHTIVQVSNAVRLELDINTDTERSDILTPSAIPHLWLELAGIARDIAANGDRP